MGCKVIYVAFGNSFFSKLNLFCNFYRCMLKIGVNYLALVEAYMTAIESAHGKSDEKKLQLMSSASTVIIQWTKCAGG